MRTYHILVVACAASFFQPVLSFRATLFQTKKLHSFSSMSTNLKCTADESFNALEIRVGKIVGIETHPEASNLYVEQVDVGDESGPRTIVSGLAQYCDKTWLLGRSVVVLCNLKPRSLKGIISHGMLLCASNNDHNEVDPLSPPTDAAIGELITVGGRTSKFIEPGNRASKCFQKVVDNLYVDSANIATFKGVAFATATGVVTSQLQGKIS